MRYLFGLYQYAQLSSEFLAEVLDGDLDDLAENLSSSAGPHVLPQLHGKPEYLQMARLRHFQLLQTAFGNRRLRSALYQELSALRSQMEEVL